ncbi:lysylphosphatidylglycerol synthase transmembrane domain-containing protein [Paraflavisolibacter sp. H34]|uniref:lysylphosphatidylglycerol synthase transmembrane domain-containing protein n=1 Tax=Huijunlia imazamoxiresistens TaxID=3127457 RepID=UPI0030176C8D
MSAIPDTPPSPVRKALTLFLKIAVTLLCFWYMSTKIDFQHTFHALLKANWWLLAGAVLLYTLSKVVSSFRLNIYLRNINLRLPEWENLKLYWLGMFYNLFLPGSIGGDAYKVILLNRKRQAPLKKTSSAVLLDRFSGLLGLGAILAIYGVIVLDNALVDTFLIAGSLLAVGAFYGGIRFFFKDFLPGFFPTLFWGLVVQGIQVGCVYLILASLGLPLQPQWLFIFLLASVVAVFPVSMGGGLGTRELVFAEGAKYFHLAPELGVTISLLFFLCNLLSCVWGAWFVFNDPLKTTQPVTVVTSEEA